MEKSRVCGAFLLYFADGGIKSTDYGIIIENNIFCLVLSQYKNKFFQGEEK